MPKIDIAADGKDIVFETTWIESSALKQLPGVRWNPNERLWHAPLSWATCVIARGLFGQQLIIGDRLNEWAGEELKRRIQPALALRERIDGESIIDLPGLFPFQRIGAEWLITARDGLLSDEQGTGKTIQTLAALRYLHEHGEQVFPTVIVCPNGVKRNWATECKKWFPQAEPIIISGTPVQKAKLFKHASEVDNALVIINFEATWLHSRLAGFGSIRLLRCRECDTSGDVNLSATRCETHPKDLNKLDARVVVVDEAHRIKEPKSKQTRAVWAIGQGANVERHWALTGTPIANAPDDLWSIMHFVSRLEHPSKTKWVDRFALLAWNAYGGLDIVGLNPEHRDEFYKIFDPRQRRMLKQIVAPQLPPKLPPEVRYVQMTPKQRKAYKDIDEMLLTQLDTGDLITTPSNLAKATRMLQFAAAYATIEISGGEEHVRLAEPSPKLDELDLIIEERRVGNKGAIKPFVVTAMHRQLIMLASNRLTKQKIPHALLVGGMAEWERDLALRNFQEGKVPILLFTMSAGGTGLTMTAADTIVYLQRSWSMVDNLQSGDRVHRIGSEIHDAIHTIDIVTEDSIEDTRLIPRLYMKLARLEEINRDAARLAAAGVDTTALMIEAAQLSGGYV